MKTYFSDPEMEIIKLKNVDIIATSDFNDSDFYESDFDEGFVDPWADEQ